MFGIFCKLQDIAERLGTVKEAHMYPQGMVIIEGVNGEGKWFRICLNMEGEND